MNKTPFGFPDSQAQQVNAEAEKLVSGPHMDSSTSVTQVGHMAWEQAAIFRLGCILGSPGSLKSTDAWVPPFQKFWFNLS